MEGILLMRDWNEGYFTESAYTYGYYRELNPVYQKFCLLANGFYPPESSSESVHCELGYGQGVSIGIHAAANPGCYIGTDFNPAHAAHANELLKASGSPSQFFDDSFEEMLDRELPKFDSISLHGIWAWVSPENQRHIVEFARRFLKPGGIFYSSYNCLPGWAPDAPLRELLYMYDKYAHKSTVTHKRVDEALNFAEELLAANPLYMKNAPNMSAHLDNIKCQDHNYLAHEYFNGNWQCVYFTEMLEALRPAKLEYACTAIPLEVIDEFNISHEARKFLRKLENPIMREQAKDYFVSRAFRKDIYIRGARRMPEQERINRILGMRYVLMTMDKVPLKFNAPVGEVVVSDKIYNPIIDYLKENNGCPKDFIEFHKEHSEISAQSLINAIIVLVHRSVISPCQSEEAAVSVKERCDRLNDYLCERAKTSDDVKFLASPVTGGAIGIDKMGQMFLFCYKQDKHDSNSMAEAMWGILSSQGQMMTKEKRMEPPEEDIAELKSRADNFFKKVLPTLKALQIA